MSIKSKPPSLFEHTFGSKSDLNLLGKIVLSPLIVAVLAGYYLCDTLFSRKIQ